jgi:hypothetical protein
MRIRLTCIKCAGEHGDGFVSGTIHFTDAEPRDNHLYQVTCPNGHETYTILQEQKFQILFEIGAHAIADGYYREAVSSFTSALERFYEFYVRVICSKRGIAPNEFDKAWRQVPKQSERQLGAFVFAYLLEKGKCPTLSQQRKVEFRNEVIHKGRIPTRSEAIDYGQAILELILPHIDDLMRNSADALNAAVMQHIVTVGENIPFGREVEADTEPPPVVTLTIGTVLSMRGFPDLGLQLANELTRIEQAKQR